MRGWGRDGHIVPEYKKLREFCQTKRFLKSNCQNNSLRKIPKISDLTPDHTTRGILVQVAT